MKRRGGFAIRAAVFSAMSCMLASVHAAQFQPTDGGNLDDAANWNNTTDSGYAVQKQQSAPLTLSEDNATLPNNGSLIYRTNVHTNDFGAEKTLTVPYLLVEENASLVHKSGKIKGTSTGTLSTQTRMASGSAVFTGTGAALEVDNVLNAGTSSAVGALAAEDGASVTAGTISVNTNSTLSAKDDGTTVTAGIFTLHGNVSVTDGAKLTVTNSLTANDGAVVTVANGATLIHDTTIDNRLTFNAGSTLSVKDSTLEFKNNKGKLYLDGGTAQFDGAHLVFGAATFPLFGGNGGTAVFTGSESDINHRFSMVGTGFTFCVSNATVRFSPETASELFITGGGASTESTGDAGSADRTLKFCGANPHLVVESTGGLHLRGTKITLLFDLPRGAFTPDPVVEIANPTGSFKGDTATLAASQIVVNIDEHTEPGTYTLLKGKGAATFLTGDDKYVKNNDRVKIWAETIDGIEYVRATVKPSGLVVVVR